MIGIINYRAGNLQNIQNSLDFIGADSKIISSPDEMEGIEKFVFPGVGAFGHAIKNLKKFGFWEPVKEKIAQGIPFLGICVGMQVLFQMSEEDAKQEGLSIVSGHVKKFKNELKVPQIGWNKVHFLNEQDPLLKGIKNDSWFYFVHSYACYPENQEEVLAKTEYGKTYCSIVKKGNLWGVQFHPEKSQNDGLQLLKNFIENC